MALGKSYVNGPGNRKKTDRCTIGNPNSRVEVNQKLVGGGEKETGSNGNTRDTNIPTTHVGGE